jgi:hypothetical protein
MIGPGLPAARPAAPTARLAAPLSIISIISAAALAGALAAAGCHKTRSTQTPPPECAAREDCPGGLAGGMLCTDGKCAGCARSRDCRLIEACDPVQRRCTLKACFGDQCQAHEQCALGQFCVQGLCLDPQHPLQQGGQTCAVQLCGSARDCNPGQRCNGRTFVCEADLGCASGDSCPAGTACNPASGACDPACTADTAVQICGAVTPCVGGRCVQCEKDADCGPGLACNLGAGRCEGPSACRTSRDCAVPLVCDRATGSCAPPRGPCDSNEQCADDERCDSRLGQCVPGACAPDRFDPNGSQATAAPLKPGSYPQLTLCGREEDWFSLQLLSGDTVQAVSGADPLGSFDLQLIDNFGAVLEEGSVAVEHLAGRDGTYYLRARTNDASALYGLRIDVAHGAACAHNPAEPHPTAQQALPLSTGQSYSWAVCPGEATWFALRAAAAGQGADVTASLDVTAGGPIGLSLYDSDGQTLLSTDASGSAAPHVTAVGSRSALFFLRVVGLTGSVATRYDLTVRLLAQ